jgi:nucleotide-binding universal stress UspA family protein
MVVVAAVRREAPNSGVVREARKLADAFGEQLHVVNVLKLSEFVDIETDSVRDSGRPEAMDDVREKAAGFAARAAEGVTEEFTAVGRVGKAATQVVQYAEEHEASYLVIGGKKRSPAGKAIFGSTTQSILLEADRPVVTVMRSE